MGDYSKTNLTRKLHAVSDQACMDKKWRFLSISCGLECIKLKCEVGGLPEREYIHSRSGQPVTFFGHVTKIPAP